MKFTSYRFDFELLVPDGRKVFTIEFTETDGRSNFILLKRLNFAKSSFFRPC